nr:MAG: ORF1 [Torque teno midi virus]
MPFWWKRRRRPWFGRFRYRRRRYNRYKGRRKRLFRRRNRKPTRRRRRRRKYKVRRKKPKIILKQWQPDSIRKCKIKGFSVLVLGAQGTQFQCYTNNASEYPQPKAPGGGGFGTEVITLKWLYQQYVAHENIWTRTNQYTDLCRYTGCKITVYRHPHIDFILSYDTQPPFLLNQYTYPELQPQNMLLAKRKKILLSKQTNPNGKRKLILKIKPPKQLVTKWFFQKDFCTYGLLRLSATAADFNYSRIGWSSQSQISTFYALNTDFYQNSTWTQTQDTQGKGYVNISTQAFPLWFKFTEKNKTQWYCYNPTDNYLKTKYGNAYLRSISYRDGFFNPRILFSSEIRVGGTPIQCSATKQDPVQDTDPTGTTTLAQLPLIPLRYNPNEDKGHGNTIYLTSVFNGRYNKPSIDTNLQFNNVPLWMGFFGYWDFILQHTANKGVYDTHMFVVASSAFRTLNQTTKQQWYPLIDVDFAMGKLPWDEYLSTNIKSKWYPIAEYQKTSINNLVMSGPYVPKLNDQKASTWELNYKYTFFFKWGGPQTSDPQIEDPCTRSKYPVPDTVQQTVQITNPEKLHTASILHDWDFRRGIVTQTALKRMSEHLETDTDFQSDDSETPKKKKKISKELPTQLQKEEKIKKCLLSLCEEPTCQEQTQDIQQLIKQHHQQQQHLRKNILKLLTHLKKSQSCMELQTGLIE